MANILSGADFGVRFPTNGGVANNDFSNRLSSQLLSQAMQNNRQDQVTQQANQRQDQLITAQNLRVDQAAQQQAQQTKAVSQEKIRLNKDRIDLTRIKSMPLDTRQQQISKKSAFAKFVAEKIQAGDNADGLISVYNSANSDELNMGIDGMLGDLAATMGKADEFLAARNKQPEFVTLRDEKGMVIGQENTDTGEVKIDPRASKLLSQAELDQKIEIAKATSTIVNVGDESIKTQLAQANLKLKEIQLQGNKKKLGEFSDAQNKSAQFASIMVQAEDNLNLALESGYDPTTAGQFAIGVTPGGNALRSEDSQTYKQAQEAWVRGKLRRESGAVIAAEEMDQEIKTFFPVFGDKPKNIAQKRRARENATKAISAAAGGALTAIQKSNGSRFKIEVIE